MPFQKIAFFICLFILCFVNFEGIIQSLFYGPEKTYMIGQMYESRQENKKNNVSLYESFAIQFLHQSLKMLKFKDILLLDAYKVNMNKLFESLTPITEIYFIPWKYNESNIETFIISVNYSIIDQSYKTYIRIYQFDDNADIGFFLYESTEIIGKLIKTSQNNESLHLKISSKQQNNLISILPGNIPRNKSILQKHTFNKSNEFLLWDQNIEFLVYIKEEYPFILYSEHNNQTKKINFTMHGYHQSEILSNPLKLSLLQTVNNTYLVVTFLALRKNSISLKYIEYILSDEEWAMFKSGTLSMDIGINPKQYINYFKILKPATYCDKIKEIYFIALSKIYAIELNDLNEKYIAIPLKLNYELDKIISYDKDYRLLLNYRDRNSPETMILELILFDQYKPYTEILRQEISKFQDCYDITVQYRQDQIILFVMTELEDLDVYKLMEYDNPFILKGSFRKILVAQNSFNDTSKFSDTIYLYAHRAPV